MCLNYALAKHALKLQLDSPLRRVGRNLFEIPGYRLGYFEATVLNSGDNILDSNSVRAIPDSHRVGN